MCGTSRRRGYTLLALGMAVALLVTACGPAAPPVTPTPKAEAKATTPCPPIKVGMLYSQTGGFALLAKQATEGVEMVLDQVKAAGGIKGCPLEVIRYDPESDTEKAVTMAKRLIEGDKVVAIIGPEVAVLHAAIAGLAVQAKIPVFTNSGGVNTLKPEDQAWAFTATPSPAVMNSALWPYLRAQGVKKWGYMGTPEAVGNRMAELGKDIGQALGMEQVGDERQPYGDKDMTPSLIKLKAKGPQGVLIIGSGEWGMIALNNAAQVGLDIPIAYAGGFSWDAFKKSLTPEVRKNMVVATSKLEGFAQLKADDPARATIAKFIDAHKAKYGGRLPEPFTAYGYDAANLLVTALKAVEPDPQKIRDQAQTVKGLMGVSGTVFSYSPDNHIGAKMEDSVVLRLEGDDIKLVGYMSDMFKKLSPDELKGLDELRKKRPSEL